MFSKTNLIIYREANVTANSKQDLLNVLGTKSVAHGWGAICTLDRQAINEILAKQFVANFNDLRFITPLNGTVEVSQYEKVVFDSLILGSPSFSFSNASLNLAKAQLRLNIISGQFTRYVKQGPYPEHLASYINISEEMGYYLTMDVDLGSEMGEVDRRGRVQIDYSLGNNLRCNLSASKQVSDFFARHLGEQLKNRRTLVLGQIDCSANDPLAPKSFRIRTQAAPGAQRAGAENADDGAIVIFIRLNANEYEGTIPTNESGFPYLIADDKDGSAKALYSATLLISEEMTKYSTEEQISVLKNLFFLDELQLDVNPSDNFTPKDRVMFGKVAPAATAAQIEPLQLQMVGGGQQQFQLRNGSGQLIDDVEWSARCLTHPLLSGSIDKSGTYKAVSKAVMEANTLPISVTATYSDNNITKQRSALVMSSFSGVKVAPQISACEFGEYVDFVASTVMGGALEWNLLDAQHGELKRIDDNHFQYIAPKEALPDAITLQSIQVKNKVTGESMIASVVISSVTATETITPLFVPEVTAGGTFSFTVKDYDENYQYNWKVLGEGEIDEKGNYSVPPKISSDIAVIVCTRSISIINTTGYAIVRLAQSQPERPKWSKLQNFSVKILGNENTVYTNGLQQLPILVEIETQAVNFNGIDLDVPISDIELASLVLVDRTGSELPFIDVSQEGIEFGSTTKWAVNEKRNRFSYFSNLGSREHIEEPSFTVNARPNATRYKELYLHLQGGEVKGLELFARFQSENNGVFSSTDEDWQNNTITVEGIEPPVFSKSDYFIERLRVKNGPGETVRDDDFSYYLSSIDYWTFTCKKDGYKNVPFCTLKIEGNTSTIRWESEKLKERFFSSTASCLIPRKAWEGTAKPAGMAYDANLRLLNNRNSSNKIIPGFPEDKQPDAGVLTVSLSREDNMNYWQDKWAYGDSNLMFRKKLNPPVTHVLLDEQGNRHKLIIGFASPTLEDNRNRLELTLPGEVNTESGVSENDAAQGTFILVDEYNLTGSIPVPPAGSSIRQPLTDEDSPFRDDAAHKINYGNLPSATVILLTGSPSCNKTNDQDYWIELTTTRQPTSIPKDYELLRMDVFANRNVNEIIYPGLQLTGFWKESGAVNYYDTLSGVYIETSANGEPE